MKKIIILSLTVLLSTASVAVESQSNMLLLAGPLQSYNAQTGTAVILGQNVSVGAQSLPEAGFTVAVFGTINSDGSLNVSSVGAADGLYVPGATEVFLSGVVKTSDPVLDRITVGGVTVDLGGTIRWTAMPPVGATIQLVGTQPAIGGLILAQAINVGPLQNVTSASVVSLKRFVLTNNPMSNIFKQTVIGITGSGGPGILH